MRSVITGYRLTDDVYSRLTDIGASESPSKGGLEQSLCLCVCLMGVDAQRKLIKQRSAGRHPEYPRGNLTLFYPSFGRPHLLGFSLPASLSRFI